MKKEISIAEFENKKIRMHYDEASETCFFSIVDILAKVTESANSNVYLKKLRKRNHELETYLGKNCPQVDMLANEKKERH